MLWTKTGEQYVLVRHKQEPYLNFSIKKTDRHDGVCGGEKMITHLKEGDTERGGETRNEIRAGMGF